MGCIKNKFNRASFAKHNPILHNCTSVNNMGRRKKIVWFVDCINEFNKIIKEIIIGKINPDHISWKEKKKQNCYELRKYKSS